MSRRLEVLLHGQLAGYLAETLGEGVEFKLTAAYRDLVPRPVLGQKFEDDLERTHRSRRGVGLPDFFANLVPEGRLREVIEEAGALPPGDDLALLGFVGEDLPGAVVIRASPEGEAVPESDAPPPKLEPGREEEPDESEGLRFSLAGVQLKFSMLLEDEKLALPARGQSGEWIVKLDSGTFPGLPENEISMLDWARATGFEVPEARLFPIESVVGLPISYESAGAVALAIRRFDRSDEGRVHQEDFAQAVGLPPRTKYDQITHEAMAHLVRRFVDEEAVRELVRRLALVIAAGNSDAHLKNWSLVYPDRIQARWSPLYDQVSTVAWRTPPRKLSLKLGGVKDFGRIDQGAIERFAERAGIERREALDLAHETLARLRHAWREISPALPLLEDHRRALREHWRRVPLLRHHGALE